MHGTDNSNLEEQVKVVIRDTSQVKASVTYVISEVANLSHDVTQVRNDVTNAINAGNADREQAFYAASAVIANHPDARADWGPWPRASDANHPDAGAEASAPTARTAGIEADYVVTPKEEAPDAAAATVAS